MSRTREQFIDLHRYEFGGMILDAVTTKLTGAPLALFLQQISAKIDARLGKAYDDLMKQPVGNGKPAEVKGKT
jgi:hypothetical protein